MPVYQLCISIMGQVNSMALEIFNNMGDCSWIITILEHPTNNGIRHILQQRRIIGCGLPDFGASSKFLNGE